MSSNWSFSKQDDWKNLYKSCSNDNQSPINIDKDKVRVCNLMCQLKMKYKSSSCKISNADNLINILYDEGSYVQYKSNDKIKYNLFKCVPHIPSLHKINDIQYDMEFCLYHKNNAGKLLIISVMVNENDNFSNSQDFLNQFIPNLKNRDYKNTSNNLDYDYSIGVASNWNVESIMPILKNFFVYKGTLPYPPCTNDVKCKKIENKSLNFLEKESTKKKKNSKNNKDSGIDTKMSNFFDSNIWANLKFIFIWVVVLYIAYVFIAPSIGYSYTYNKTLYEFKENGKELFKETYDSVKMNEDYVRKLIEKYLFKKLRIIDLSTDTWFNQYIIRIPHHLFSSAMASLTGKKGVKDE